MAQSANQKAAFAKMLASRGKGKTSAPASKKDVPSPFDMKTGVDVGKGPKTIPPMPPKGKMPSIAIAIMGKAPTSPTPAKGKAKKTPPTKSAHVSKTSKGKGR